MEWRLRRAVADDAAALSLVAGATFLETYAHFMIRENLLAHLAAKSSPERFAAWATDGASVVTLAESPAGRAPLGYTVLTVPDLPVEQQPGDVELLRIYTLATSWGSGLGAALMERTLADARDLGLRRVLLGTHPENYRAHRFYDRFGFTVIGRRIFRVGDAEFDDPVYALTL